MESLLTIRHMIWPISFRTNARNIRIKTRKERKYSFPIRQALLHRLKVRMMPFKDAEKPAKVFMEKLMDIIALFLMPLSYVIFQDMFAPVLRTIV